MDVVSRDGLLVHLPVLVALLYLVAGVAQVDVVAFLTSEFHLPGGLYAGLSGVVSGTIFTGMPLDVVGVHLGDVAEQVATGVDRIVAYASGLPPESREVVLKLGEPHVGLRLYLLEHYHALVAYAATVPGIFLHLVPDEVGRDVECAGQHQGVELLDLPWGDEDVVGDFVADDDLVVAVVDDASGRVDDVVDHRVVGRVDLVLVVDDLDVEQLPEDDGRHNQKTDDQRLASTFCLHRPEG